MIKMPSRILALSLIVAAPLVADIPTQFERYFYGAIRSEISPEGFNKLILSTKTGQTDLLTPPFETDKPQAILEQLGGRYRQINPGLLYTRTINKDDAQDPRTVLEKKPVTVVLVPGIFGEFIKTRAFEEVFKRQNSTAAKAWKNAVASIDDEELTFDSVYSLKDQGVATTPIENLIHVASVDNGEGKVLVQLVLFNSPRMSLETLGKSEERAEVYLRRLNKLFKLLPATGDIVFVGYSRGTITGLSLLAKANADEANYPWLKQVSGMVSLGGVTFGSDLADEAHKVGTPSQKQLAYLSTLADSLQLWSPIPAGTSFARGSQIVAHNTSIFNKNNALWIKFGYDMASVSGDSTFLMSLLSAITGLPAGDPNATRWNQVVGFAKALQKEFALSSANFGLRAFSVTEHNNNVAQYNNDIKRFRTLIKHVLVGVSELTTKSRTEWWSNPKNVLPTESVRYFTVAAAMIDPNWETKSPDKVTKNTFAYDIGSIDYTMLRKNAEDFRRATGFSLNDSQVAVHKVHLWPQLAEALNPAYRANKIDSRFLALLGTHHWALALETVNQQPGIRNPFPREALLLAIAASVASAE